MVAPACPPERGRPEDGRGWDGTASGEQRVANREWRMVWGEWRGAIWLFRRNQTLIQSVGDGGKAPALPRRETRSYEVDAPL
ncbi:MAG: hypothetical protein KatS3mg077_2809 [Candidatus Binatia bacterium]|nr:MAG: hypothetical protein KatS3mg077_2809 [Candidatus Binatia bacterium]